MTPQEKETKFNPEGLTIHDIALYRNSSNSELISKLPSELANESITAETLNATSESIYLLRFKLINNLKKVAGINNEEFLKELLNNSETTKIESTEVKNLVQKIRFLANLEQDVLYL